MRTRRSYQTVCHPGRPHVAKGLCGACRQYLSKADAEGLISERSTKLLEVVAGHEDRKTEVDASYRKLRVEAKQRDPSRYRQGRDKALRGRYGITIEEYEIMCGSQGGVCAVCRRPPDGQPLYVDHRHDNGVVRGLLCARCNTAVAVIDAGPERFTELTVYAKRGAP